MLAEGQAAPAPADDRSRYALIARALAGCSFLPGCWDKRFARDMAFIAEHSREKDFSERQRVHLVRLAHKYRRQLATATVMLAQDLAEAAAERRVAAGLGALADFSPRERPRRPRTKKATAAALADPTQGVLL
jgi:hypothetical protein